MIQATACRLRVPAVAPIHRLSQRRRPLPPVKWHQPRLRPIPFPGKPVPGFDSNPELQLFDFSAGRWYEFPHLDVNNGYVVKDPGRYVDPNGRVLARLVNRSTDGSGTYFQIIARLEGTIEP